MFDLAKATLETKNPFWRKRPQLRKRRREFRELNKHYEELLKKTTNIEELIKAVRDQKLTEDANEAKNQIKGIIVEWEELINGLFNIEKTAIIVEFITIDPLEYVGEWVTRVKEQLIALHHEIREKFAGRVDQADMESKFNGMVKDYESAHQTFARIYQKEMSELEKQYRITISQAEGKSDMVRDLQNFMGVVDKRMAISNSLYNERGEVKSVDKDIKEVKDIAAEAAKRLRKEIKDGSVDDLPKIENLLKEMKSELEKLDVDFTKMLKDFMMTILLISQIIVGFRAKAEESMETIISLLNQSKIDKKNEAELRERVKAAKEKMHHAADVLENITKRIGRKEQQNNDLAKAA